MPQLMSNIADICNIRSRLFADALVIVLITATIASIAYSFVVVIRNAYAADEQHGKKR